MNGKAVTFIHQEFITISDLSQTEQQTEQLKKKSICDETFISLNLSIK